MFVNVGKDILHLELGLPDTSARIYRPSFHENKPKTLVFSHTKRALWACFHENWVYNFGHSINSFGCF